MNRHRTRRAAAAIGVLCLTLLGCDVTPLIKEDKAWVNPQALWRQARNDFVVVFEAIPRTPAQGREADFQVTIHDDSKEPPQPVSDAKIIGIAVIPRMPGHVRELELKPGLAAAAPGIYRARSTFDTKGKWLAKLLIHLSSGEKINVEFPFEVR
jgi:hypothetical protein